jgi:hypothetical protein
MSKENFGSNPHLINEEKQSTDTTIKNTLLLNVTLNNFYRTQIFHCGGYEEANLLDITPLIS